MRSVINLGWVSTRYDYNHNLLITFAKEKNLIICDCQINYELYEAIGGNGVEGIYCGFGKRLTHLYTHQEWYTHINKILELNEQKYYPIIDCMVYFMKLYSKKNKYDLPRTRCTSNYK